MLGYAAGEVLNKITPADISDPDQKRWRARQFVQNETSWMTDIGHSQGMPDTGDRREITRFANAKETEAVQESKKLVSKTKQRSAETAQEDRSRKRRNVSSSSDEKLRETQDHRRDQDASERMADEGGPNLRP